MSRFGSGGDGRVLYHKPAPDRDKLAQDCLCQCHAEKLCFGESWSTTEYCFWKLSCFSCLCMCLFLRFACMLKLHVELFVCGFPSRSISTECSTRMNDAEKSIQWTVELKQMLSDFTKAAQQELAEIHKSATTAYNRKSRSRKRRSRSRSQRRPREPHARKREKQSEACLGESLFEQDSCPSRACKCDTLFLTYFKTYPYHLKFCSGNISIFRQLIWPCL